jgi:hypothetical protein
MIPQRARAGQLSSLSRSILSTGRNCGFRDGAFVIW